MALKPTTVVDVTSAMSATFNGVRFRIGTGKIVDAPSPFKERGRGWCTTRKAKRPLVFVCDDLPAKDTLEVLIHEMLHAYFGEKMTEKDVQGAARDIGRALWRAGYRQQAERFGA